MASSSTHSDPYLTDLARWSDEIDLSQVRENNPDLSDPEATELDFPFESSLSPIEVRKPNSLAPPEVDHGFSHSTVTAESLYNIRRNASIPPSFKLIVPSYTDNPYRPPSGGLTFFVGQLDGGLRLPMHSFFADISTIPARPWWDSASGSRSPHTTHDLLLTEDFLAELSTPAAGLSLFAPTGIFSTPNSPPRGLGWSRTLPILSSSAAPSTPPNQTFFMRKSIIKIGMVYWCPIYQGHFPYPDRAILDKLSSPDLVKSFCMDQARAHVKLSALIARARTGFADPALVRELETLRKENKKLNTMEAKLLDSVREHKDKLLGLERCH
ncbi:hypothetical protein DH2020_046683 [Rehmannia glutinosa]|uniref:Uncharacterized protein n=1 Tax=Rehmannia glutinosa TaxID=99300 RepID=A0ABR0UBA8_REHGL